MGARWTAAPPEAGRTGALPGIERMEVPPRTKKVKNDGHLQNQKRANQEMKRTKKSRKMMKSKNSKREKKRRARHTKTRRKRERKRKRGSRTHKKTWKLKQS